MTNSTFSGNIARGGNIGGGAIVNGGELYLSFVTIAFNQATTANGGGIFNNSVGVVRIKNSIVAGNTAGGAGGNCWSQGGPILSLGGNVDNDGTCFGGAGSPNINLGPLQNNGGPTQTHALQAGSVAIGAAIDCTDAQGNSITEDQRGIPRPQPAVGACDAGAYEARQFRLTVQRIGTGSGTANSSPTGISCGLDCTEDYSEGTTVQLMATPDPGSSFAGWGGACSGVSPSTSVVLDANKTCTVLFQLSRADLRISKRASPDPVVVGQSLLYTIEVMNRGPATATNVQVEDFLPEDVQLEGVSGTGWSCSSAGNQVTCTRPSIPAQTTAPPIRVSVRAPLRMITLTNTASVRSSVPDQQLQDNQASVETPVVGPTMAFFMARFSPTGAEVSMAASSSRGVIVADPLQDHVRVFAYHKQEGLKLRQTIRVGRGPVAVAVGDVTGDEWTDAVTANFLGRSVTVVRGRGDGTFEPRARTFTIGGRPGAIGLGDFNRDGRLDLVVTYLDTGQLELWLGRGDGTFRAGRRIAVGKQPVALAIADINRDGFLDAAVADWDSSDVTVLLGKPGGALASAQEVSVGMKPTAVTASDLNGDGYVELIVVNHRESSISILQNEGNGRGTVRFRSVITVPTADAPLGVAVGRFSSTGLSLACVGANAREIWLYQLDERMIPSLKQKLTATNISAALTAGDLNEDGWLDVIALDALGELLEVWTADERGIFHKRLYR
ncbi:MAG: FG-GAP-like repeat-containing protein [Blastocatellia bacterium]|nr:FG-GAP-like repeat-containing protein [Blastocatellia bacterium]MDW8256218.1 FG-GAP-like repeat-containing protein [Acidobacteriota bacterium]